jgi:hypothetical protein
MCRSGYSLRAAGAQPWAGEGGSSCSSAASSLRGHGKALGGEPGARADMVGVRLSEEEGRHRVPGWPLGRPRLVGVLLSVGSNFWNSFNIDE